jgi:O-antigen/teichoic acid export membrane protein
LNTVRRIAKDTLVLFIAQIVSMGLGFFIQEDAALGSV